MNIYSKIVRKTMIYYGKVTTLISKIQFKMHGISFGNGVSVRGIIKIYGDGNVVIGNQTRFNSAYWANPIGGGIAPPLIYVIKERCQLDHIVVFQIQRSLLQKRLR